MAALKLHRTDEGIGATFPEDVLARLKVGEGDTLNIQHTPDGILLTSGEAPRAEVMRVARKIMQERAAVLRALAT